MGPTHYMSGQGPTPYWSESKEYYLGSIILIYR